MPGLAPGIHVLLWLSKKDVDGRGEPGHDEKEILLRLTEALFQCTAAYMIFSSVASSAENSSTTLPCRDTRMRSDSAMISGR